MKDGVFEVGDIVERKQEWCTFSFSRGMRFSVSEVLDPFSIRINPVEGTSFYENKTWTYDTDRFELITSSFVAEFNRLDLSGASHSELMEAESLIEDEWARRAGRANND